MATKYFQHLDLGSLAGRVIKVKVDHLADLFKAQTQSLQLIDLLKPRDRLFGITVLSPSLALTRRDKAEALVVADGTRSDFAKLGEFSDPHHLVHSRDDKCSKYKPDRTNAFIVSSNSSAGVTESHT